jgi:hypothetical protein
LPKKVKKKGKGKGHHHCPPKKGAGNPLDPNDKTIGQKFWSA